MRKLKTERRPEILDAALAIADERGLDALSMRAVADRVGVTPMALYGYFRNKDELLDGLVGRLLGDMPPVDPELDGRERLGAMAHGFRQVALRHPAVFPLMFSRPSVTPDAVRVSDAVYQALLDCGVPDDQVPRMERLATTFIMGWATSEVSGRFSASAASARARRGADLPAHQRLAPYLDGPRDLDAEFDADLADLFRIIRPE
ncbi:TetR/AcrR family transcriptional regulator [Nonomuraea sp. NPDC050556]|uniref:TetR/AcrR family transcriptional regulator n=1 Tax=Nonomuraea sp. NPDC050556 TaxID=3364369 RepID=UPI00379540C0